MGSMPLAEVVATSQAVAAESGRSAKRDLLAELLSRLDPSAPHEVEAVVGLLTGEPRQGRIGVGWASVSDLVAGTTGHRDGETVDDPVTVAEIDALVDALDSTRGEGSQAARRDLLQAIADRAGPDEVDFVRRVFIGEVRQGALAGVMTDAAAVAAGVPATVLRRAVMLGGDLGQVVAVALRDGREAVEAIGLRVGRPIAPMLASGASDVDEALADLGEAIVEWKLDGIRIQVHRDGDDISVFTRNLNDITDRVPDVVVAVAALEVTSVVLDGEAMAVADDGRPVSFPDIAGEVARHEQRAIGVMPFLFDCMHLDGVDLIDAPLAQRHAALERVAPHLRVPGRTTAAPGEAAEVLAEALDAGHEGVVCKAPSSTYAAGRRGKSWRKVKPVHTLDLVVIAVEWGHGRRRGYLSNLWLGARGDDGFVMVGKTFKGLTDELLAWQTEALLAREVSREGHVVHVRPELVVEIALDGVLPSPRYPGGVALRFARVRRYRQDRSAADADTIDAVRALRR